jgi:hypothetical protein
MESHDEDRVMYRTKAEGNNTVTSYDVRNDSIALRRMEAATSLFLAIPGPKMIWEFGERGYDKSIYACVNNTIPQPYGTETCKLSRKEPRWEYMQDAKRKRLYDITAALLKLRNTQTALFSSSNFSYSLVNNVKYFKISEPNLSALVIANFDVVSTSTPITFQSSGTWYDYLTGETITATGASQLLPLLPGEYHVYLDHNITNVITTPVFDIDNPGSRFGAVAYPNPVNRRSVLELNIPETGNSRIDLYNIGGKLVQTIYSGSLSRGVHMMPLLDKFDNLPGGIYLLRIQTKNHIRSLKILVQ